MPYSLAGKTYLSHGSINRHSSPVGDEIRRTHDIHKLLIHLPATLVRESFGLQEHFMPAPTEHKHEHKQKI